MNQFFYDTRILFISFLSILILSMFNSYAMNDLPGNISGNISGNVLTNPFDLKPPATNLPDSSKSFEYQSISRSNSAPDDLKDKEPSVLNTMTRSQASTNLKAFGTNNTVFEAEQLSANKNVRKAHKRNSRIKKSMKTAVQKALNDRGYATDGSEDNSFSSFSSEIDYQVTYQQDYQLNNPNVPVNTPDTINTPNGSFQSFFSVLALKQALNKIQEEQEED